jgi:hypothetical protein
MIDKHLRLRSGAGVTCIIGVVDLPEKSAKEVNDTKGSFQYVELSL